MEQFSNRKEAGKRLAVALQEWQRDPNAIVLALPRGGAPVAFEVAQALQLPLDIYLVQKLGVPGHEELAMGAIGSGEVQVLNEEIIQNMEIPREKIDVAVKYETEELQRREQAYRGDRPRPKLSGRIVILVDDGIATGATFKTAIRAVQKQDPQQVVAAVPIAPAEVLDELRPNVSELVCLRQPDRLHSIGLWYTDFGQVDDETVQELLVQAQQPEGG